MLGSRLRQFREYNGFHIDAIAEMLGITSKEYLDIENGKADADIDILSKLAKYYRVTIDELYGYNPRLSLHSKNIEPNDEVDKRILKMSELTWEEAQIILYYRSLQDKDEDFKDDLISEIIKRNNE